jgi:hypothetical protein
MIQVTLPSKSLAGDIRPSMDLKATQGLFLLVILLRREPPKPRKPQRAEEKTHYHRADIEKMRGDQNVFKNNVDVFRTPHLYTGMQPHELEGDHETVLHNVKKKMVSNIVFRANHVKSGAFGSKDDFDKWRLV